MSKKYFFGIFLLTFSFAKAQDTISYRENGKVITEIYEGEKEPTTSNTFSPRIEYGLNLLTPNVYPIKTLQSRFFAFGGQYRLRIGQPTRQMGLGIGIEFSWNHLRWDREGAFLKATDSVRFASSGTFSYNRLSIVNLGIPILWYKTFEKWRLGAGVYADIRLHSFTKTKSESNGNKSEIKEFSDFYLRPFRYGLRIEAKYKILRIFAKYDLPTTFQSDRAQNTHLLTFGIGI